LSKEPDPLRALVVDTRQISREKLAEILKDKVLLDLQTETFMLVSEVRAHSTGRQAVLLSLLARKALSLLQEDVVDAMSPKDLAAVTGMKGSTIRPILKRLTDEGLIVRRPEGYAVHVSAFARVAFALTHK
jgi:DNA-binding MarR family transcriptional regulator